MRIGLVARTDCGGLSAQSQEFAKNLPIAATLVVDLGDKGRGPGHPFDWANPIFVRGPHIDQMQEVELFLDQVDVVLSIETFYGVMITELAARRGIPTVRYANPELFRDEGQTHVVLPTTWETDRVPNATVIPQGVSVQQTAFIRETPAKTLLHFAAPAMLDRNGTIDFHAALSKVKASFRVIIVGQEVKQYHRSEKHEWINVSDYDANRFSHYSKDIDLHVMPRRYGGLCLPALEAASFGIPSLMSKLPPQDKWFGHDSLIPVTGAVDVPMVNGKFTVYSADIDSLAYRLDRYAKESVEQLSNRAFVYSQKNSWSIIAPMWVEYLSNLP